MMAIDDMQQEVEDLARELGAIIPAPARRQGWALADLQIDRSIIDDDDPTGLFSCRLVGPVRVETTWRHYVGRRPDTALVVRSGDVGTLDAPTREQLVVLVRRAVEAFRLEDVRDPR